MTSASFMPEYKRQWIADLKRKGLYKDPKLDSVKLKKTQDSLDFIKKQKEKLQKQIDAETQTKKTKEQ
jgi:penicillin-binding protein 2